MYGHIKRNLLQISLRAGGRQAVRQGWSSPVIGREFDDDDDGRRDHVCK